MADILLEVCVDDAAGWRAAVAGGADRIELCSALALGGLTPGPGLIALAAAGPVPVAAMIRPRPGDFVWSAEDVAVMRADIRAMRGAGLAGVVLGANLPDGRLDRAVLADLLAEAAGMETVLHRAVDLCPDAEEAVETAVELGFTRILSSGGALRAVDGLARLAAMQRQAAGRLVVMPGSGVSVETLPALAGALALTEVHASCAQALAGAEGARALGFVTGAERRSDAGTVAALKAALRALPAAG